MSSGLGPERRRFDSFITDQFKIYRGEGRVPNGDSKPPDEGSIPSASAKSPIGTGQYPSIYRLVGCILGTKGTPR